MALTTKKYGNLDFSGGGVWGNFAGAGNPYAITFNDKSGKSFYYVPEDVITRGTSDKDNSYYFNYFLDNNNINNFAKKAEYVSLNDLPFASAIKSAYGVGEKGFLVPADIGFDSQSPGVVPKSRGSITGLSYKDGQLVYGLSASAGNQYGWISPDYSTHLQPERRKSGGLRGLLEGAGNALISAGPVLQLAAAISANPVLYGIAAGTQLGQGNLMGAALNMAGMAGAVPGIDAATAKDLKAAQSVLQVSNALKNDNPIAALSALGGLSGVAVPPEVARGAQLIALNDALQRGDMKSLAVAVGNISNTPEVAYAGKAAKVLEAIDSGNINKVAASLNTLLPELRSAYKSTDFKTAFSNIGADLTDDQFSKIDQMLGTNGEQLINASIAGVAETQAQHEGWRSAADKEAATNLGFATPAEYEGYTAAQSQAAEEALAANQATGEFPTQTAQTTGDETQTTGGLPSIGGTSTGTYRTTGTAGTTSAGTSTAPSTAPSTTQVARRQYPGGLPQYGDTGAAGGYGMPQIGIPNMFDLDTAPQMLGTTQDQQDQQLVSTAQGIKPSTGDVSGMNQPIPGSLGSAPFNPGQVQELSQLFGSLTPEMRNVMVDQNMVHPDILQASLDPMKTPMMMSTGGSTISNIQEALKYKPIASAVEPMLKAAPVSESTAKLKSLRHLRQSIVPSSPFSSSEGLARGGLPSKYHEAAPDGHHPEFVTGLTGYYAGGRGTGQSDDIPAMLHDGDYVMDAEVVSALGDGSSKAGKGALTHFLGQVPHRDSANGKPVPAKIADGEFVLPESFVTSLGGGDNRRGARMLDEMRERLREHKRSAPTSKIPPKAKSPLEYLEGVKG